MKVFLSFILIFALVAIAVGDEPKAAGQEIKKEQKMERYVQVLMKTTMGDITIDLDQEKAPVTVANFLKYANEKTYDGTIFHRVIDGFMIQGGGFNEDMSKRPTHEPIVNEWENGLKNMRGTISMARLGNQPNSATNQFFINLVDNAGLDLPRDGAGYAVFGHVSDGMDVVDAIAKVETGNKMMHQNVPVKPVIITEVSVIMAKGKTSEEKPAEKPKTPEEGNTE